MLLQALGACVSMREPMHKASRGRQGEIDRRPRYVNVGKRRQLMKSWQHASAEGVTKQGGDQWGAVMVIAAAMLVVLCLGGGHRHVLHEGCHDHLRHVQQGEAGSESMR